VNAAGVAVAVEHARKAQALGVVGKAPAIVALVEVKPRLVPFGDVHRELPGVLADAQLERRRRRLGTGRAAAQPARRGRQPFELARARVRALVEFAQARGAQQRVGQRLLVALGAGARELRDQRVRVAIDDHAGQPVGFAMHQAQAVALNAKSGSSAYGTGASSF